MPKDQESNAAKSVIPPAQKGPSLPPEAATNGNNVTEDSSGHQQHETVRVDEHGYCAPSQYHKEPETGYNCLDILLPTKLKGLTERFQGVIDNGKLKSGTGRQLFDMCQHNSNDCTVKELFSTSIEAMIRAVALDPYGMMIQKNRSEEEGNLFRYTFKCSHQGCSASLMVRSVTHSNQFQGQFALFGCKNHSNHSMPLSNKSQVVFKNHKDAVEFVDKYLEREYQTNKTRDSDKGKKRDYTYLKCRRQVSVATKNYHACKSYVSVHESFPNLKIRKDGKEVTGRDRPFSVGG